MSAEPALDALTVLKTEQLNDRLQFIATAFYRARVPADTRTALAAFELALTMFKEMGAPWQILRQVFEHYANGATVDNDPLWPR